MDIFNKASFVFHKCYKRHYFYFIKIFTRYKKTFFLPKNVVNRKDINYKIKDGKKTLGKSAIAHYKQFVIFPQLFYHVVLLAVVLPSTTHAQIVHVKTTKAFNGLLRGEDTLLVDIGHVVSNEAKRLEELHRGLFKMAHVSNRKLLAELLEVRKYTLLFLLYEFNPFKYQAIFGEI